MLSAGAMEPLMVLDCFGAAYFSYSQPARNNDKKRPRAQGDLAKYAQYSLLHYINKECHECGS